MEDGMQYPVHDSITVYDGVDIYNTSDWRKAAIRYGYGEDDSTVAIYLWHHDGDGWKRKNKYNIKTAEAWAMDKTLIESYLDMEVSEAAPPGFPVSDYYHIAAGETVFTTEEWKKGIVVVDEKGDYETHEVMIYLWQNVDGKWRRRQKYTIKSVEDWNRDKEAIEEVMGESTPSTPTVSETQQSDLDLESPDSDSPIAKMAAELGLDVSDDDTFQRELEKIHVAPSSGD